MTSKTSTNCVGRAVTTAVTGDLVTSWGNRRRLASILRRAFRIVGMGKQRAIGKLAGAGVIGMTSIAIATSGGSASAQVFQSDNSAAAAPPVASGANSSAGGYGASATGAGSTVVGNSATDNGNGGAVAIGNNAAVTNGNAIAIGSSAAAAGNHSVALGSNTSAQGTEDIAIGYLAAAATGTQSVAIGSHASAADQATALGNDVKASGSSSVAIGGDDLNEVALTHGAIYTSLTGSTLTANTYISTQASDGSTARPPAR